MPRYEVELHGRSREVYVVDTDDIEAARRLVEDAGWRMDPVLTEIEDAEIATVKLVSDG